MPLYFSKSIGKRNLERTLSIDIYIERLDNGTLTPTTKSLGYWTYAKRGTPPPTANSEAELFDHFRAQWNFTIVELALKHNIPLVVLKEALDKVALSPMASSLSSVPEDSTSTSASPIVSPVTSPASREQRRERLDVLNKALRPPPFTHIWEFWYDKHVSDSAAGQPAYENRVKSLLQVSDIKEFYQFYNNTPLTILKIRDSLHLFKKTVKPVWEDPRNLKGGAWTFRVNKDKSTKFWEEIMLLAVGETLQDAVVGQRGDDICGVTLSNRFNSHLVQIWHRDGSNKTSIDKILKIVLENLSPELRPKPESYYYKKHSDHKGYNVSAANAQPAKTIEARIEASPDTETQPGIET